MAAKKSKPKEKAASKGVVGLLKKMVSRSASAPSKTQKAKPVVSARGKGTAKGKAAPSKLPNGKTAAAKGTGTKQVVPPEPEKVKKKPPSITITRPEATRPPIVLPPPRPLEAPIGAPNILLPKGGAPTGSLTPILRWMYVGGATRYEVEWSHDAHFGRGHSTTIVAAQTMITLEAPNDLQPATNYKWRVRGGNDAGWGPWSPPESFRSPEKQN